MTDTQEQMEKAKDEFLKGNLNFPVGTHEAVAKVLGVPVETVQRIRENRNREAQHRIKLREAVDNENILHTVWDNRGCDLTKDGNRLTVGQLKQIIANLPDEMDIYTHQYIPSVGMESLPCETIKIAASWKFGSPEDKQNIMIVE